MLDLSIILIIMKLVDREDRAMLRSNLSARSMPRDGQGYMNSHMPLLPCPSFGLKAINLLAWGEAACKAKATEYGRPVGHMSISTVRYERIQKLRQQDQWTARQRSCPVGNIRQQFIYILEHARIEHGTFHDLRRTCLTNWLVQGLSEYEVMILAGHASFDTTHKFYLAVRDDILDRARKASTQVMERISIAFPLQANFANPKARFCPP